MAMAERTITVEIPGQANVYPVLLNRGVIAQSTQLADVFKHQCLPLSRHAKRWLIITDEHVAPLYLEDISTALSALGCEVHSVVLPAGERAKTWEQLQYCLAEAAKCRLTRHDGVLALGGGVISDIAGLVAALHYRGCRFGVVSTTLLAQVDASVGGKVAINSTAGKNTVGTFYQPDWVLMDLDVLTTLPEREFNAGMAEVVKTALLEITATVNNAPPVLWKLLIQSASELAQQKSSAPALAELIQGCVQVKQAVVALDVNESGSVKASTMLGSPRMWLNLGHTFAHGYEQLFGYDGRCLHGEAVAIGLIDAFHVSAAMGLIAKHTVAEVETLMADLELTTSLAALLPANDMSVDALLAAMAGDKKHTATQQRFVLPVNQLGEVAIYDDVPQSVLRDVLTKRLAG